MCTYSMIADHYTDRWQRNYPGILNPVPMPNGPLHGLGPGGPTRAEFDALRKEVADIKDLLVKAKEYDVRNNEPECEMADKVALLKKIAEIVGVDLSEALPKQAGA